MCLLSLVWTLGRDTSLELKALLEHLKYAYLGEHYILPVIIASYLTGGQEESLMSVLRREKEAIGWTMSDIKEISPAIVPHHIHLNNDTTPKRDPQRRLNPIMQDAVKRKFSIFWTMGSIIPFLIAMGKPYPRCS